MEPDDPLRNQVLAALPPAALERLRGDLQPMRTLADQVLYEAGARPAHVVFPTTAIASLRYTMESGASAEMGIIGCDGMIGLGLFLGGGSMPHRAVVRSPGHALRLRAEPFRVELRRAGALQRALLLYTQALLTQLTMTAACNRLHSLEQQLCRWLLLSHDRLRTQELLMTQEAIAQLLGVRREGVSVAAHRLQAAGLIRYSRGRIVFLDRPGLEAAACECYRVIRTECDRLQP